MPYDRSFRPLRTLLLLDAATCTAMAVLLMLAAAPLAVLTALPPDLLFHAGLILLPVAAYMVAVAARALHSRPAVALVVAGNALWVAASLLLPAAGRRPGGAECAGLRAAARPSAGGGRARRPRVPGRPPRQRCRRRLNAAGPDRPRAGPGSTDSQP